MKTFLLFLFAFLIATEAEAQRITASVTVTNLTTNGMTFTVNGNVRTWTNQVFNSGSQILTNADATGSGSKTNLFNQIALNQFPQTILSDTGSNTFNLVGAANAALVVTPSAGYASVSYSTQAVSTAVVVRIPVSIEQPAVRTNIESGLVTALNDSANTNALDQNATVASQLMGIGNAQTITGQKILMNGVLSNGFNVGAAFSSPGAGLVSEQFGTNATASNAADLAVGPNSTANGGNSIAVGSTASATGSSSMAVGNEALASGSDAVAAGDAAHATGASSIAVGGGALAINIRAISIGTSSQASESNSIAFGNSAISAFANSTAIGNSAVATTSNQVMLGNAACSTVVPANLSVGLNANVTGTNLVGYSKVTNNETVGGNASIAGNATISGNVSISGLTTNQTWNGTNNFPPGSDIAFGRFAVSSLANGNNAAVPIGTNVFIELSGPSAAFTVNGIAGGRDGKDITLLNQTGFQMTIANESGTDPTAANRIRTLGPGADLVFTNAAVGLRYNANVSRWIVISHNP